MKPDLLSLEHRRCLERCIDLFHSTRKMGGPEFSQAFEDKLKLDLTEAYDNFSKHNDSKNIFNAARTPAVLFTIVVITYIISGFFGIIGLETVANLVNIVMIIFIILVLTWMYTRYSGDHRGLSMAIDQLADLLWDNVSYISLYCLVVYCFIDYSLYNWSNVVIYEYVRFLSSMYRPIHIFKKIWILEYLHILKQIYKNI